MDRCGSHVLLNPVFSKTLRGFVAFLKVCPGVGVLVGVRSLKILIQRGFRRVVGVVEGLVRGIIKGVMTREQRRHPAAFGGDHRDGAVSGMTGGTA